MNRPGTVPTMGQDASEGAAPTSLPGSGQSASRDLGKDAVSDRAQAVARVEWGRDVIRALVEDHVRAHVLRLYRGAGFSPDDFGRFRLARESIARALTAAEDWLELEHPQRQRERATLRELRRRIEDELEGMRQ